MLDSIFITNKDANILIEKQYRAPVQRNEIDSVLLSIKDKSLPISGISSTDRYTIMTFQEGDLWLVGVCEGEDFALLPVNVLKYVGLLLEILLPDGNLTELNIKDNYPTVYQILDFAIDFGFPFLNEPNTIWTMINRGKINPSILPSQMVDLAHPWRNPIAQYSSNKIFFDVDETIDTVISQFGKVEFCHVHGEVKVTSLLSGPAPHVRLYLNPNTHYDDCTFHRCVESDVSDAKVLPFIPPDGKFILLSYRNIMLQPILPLKISPKFTWGRGTVTFEVNISPEITLPKPVSDIEISFQLPEGVSSPSLICPEIQATRAIFETNSREVVWFIGSTVNTKNVSLTLKGSASTDQNFELAGRFPVISAKFSTLQWVPTGFKIERMEVEQGPAGSYQSNKFVKYLTKAGSYECRTGIA